MIFTLFRRIKSGKKREEKFVKNDLINVCNNREAYKVREREKFN